MIERSRVRVPAGAEGEISSPGSTFCAESYFGIRSTPRLGYFTCYCGNTTAIARKVLLLKGIALERYCS